MKLLKTTLLFYFIISGLFSKAQAPTQFYSDCGGTYLGKDQSALYILSPYRDKICTLNNDDLSAINEIKLSTKAGDAMMGLPEVNIINDKFYILTLNKDRKTLTGTVLSKKGNVLESERSLHTFSKSVKFKCKILDNNLIAIIAVRPGSGLFDYTPIDILIFDEALSYLYTIPIPVSIPSYEGLLSQIRFNNNIISYSEGDRDRKFFYIDFSSKTAKPINFNLKNKISSSRVFFNQKENKRMMFAVEEKSDVIGLHLFTIGDNGEVTPVSFFPAALVPEISWSTTFDYVLQDNSGIYLAFESTSNTSNGVYHSDVSILKFGNNYEKQWAAVVKKNQFEADPATMSSYFPYLDNENVNIIYNESPENLNPNIKKQEITTFALMLKKRIKKTVCVNSKISKSNGTVDTKILYANDTNPIILVTTGKQISETNFLFCAWDLKSFVPILNLQKFK